MQFHLPVVDGLDVAQQSPGHQTLVILDASVDNLPALIADVRSHAEVHVLMPHRDGVEQITEILKGRDRLTSLHLVSHGAPGQLYLGNAELSIDTAARYAEQITAWSSVLGGADLHLYGCRVADGVRGHLFLAQLRQLTEANIAASTERVGRVGTHSNWRLETRVGRMATTPVFSPQLQAAYTGHFETVNFSLSPDTVIESEGTPFSLNFTVDGPIPAGGSVVRLEGSVAQAINQFNLFSLSTTGLAGQPVDVSPGQDFSIFEVTIVEPTASINLPVFNDFVPDSPQEITWTVTPVSAGTTVSNGSATVTIFDTADQVPAPPPPPAPAAPEVNISSNVTTLVEDEGTAVTFTISLSEPPPAGGLLINLTTGEAFGLGDFDVFPPGPQATATGGQLVSGNPDNSGFAFAVQAQTATITLPIFDDQDRTEDGTQSDPNGPLRNDDIGEEQTTFSIAPGNGYTVGSNSSVTLTLRDTNAPPPPVNTPPVADDDAYSTAFGTTVTVRQVDGLLAGDTDADGDTLTAELAIEPGNGVASLNTNGAFSYTPNPGFSGTDSFTYTVSDGNGGTDTGTVTINVGDGPPPAPTAPTVSVSASPTTLVEENGTVTTLTFTVAGEIPAGGINVTLDSDIPASLAEFDVSAASFSGAALVAANGDASGFTVNITQPGATITLPVFDDAIDEGVEDITYTLQPGDGYEVDGGASAVTITIEDNDAVDPPANMAPVADDDSYSTTVDTPLTVAAAEGVLVGDTDADGDPLVATFGGNPTNGTVDLQEDGSFVYTPNAGFVGTDSFTYQASDGQDNSEVATVSVEVVDGGSSGGGDEPVVSFSTTPGLISEAGGTALVLNFSVEGDIPEGGITVNLEGDTAEILQQFLAPDGDGAVQTRVTAEGNLLYRFDTSFEADNENFANIEGGILEVFALEDGDPAEDNSNPEAAGTGFLSNFSFTITESTASITLPVSDDLVQEADQTFTYSLAAGEGYTVDPTTNSGTFTVTDGVTPAVSPTVGVSATPTTLIESEQTVVELTFTTEGDIPAEGLVVQLQGPPRAIAEFDVNATNPRLPEAETVVEGVTVTGGNIVGTDEVAGSLFLRITDPTATITVPVFDDTDAEGTEVLSFNLVDGEAYEVDPAASAIDVTIEDVAGPLPVVSFSTTPGLISEADGTALVLNFSVEGDIPEGGITVNLEGDTAEILQQFLAPDGDGAVQTRVTAEGNLLYRFDTSFEADNENFANIEGGILEVFALEDGDPAEDNSNPEAAGTGFLSNFSFTITESTASITLPVSDDLVQEADQTFTYSLAAGEGYTIDPTTNSGTFTVTDGVTPAVSPTVGVSATPTTLIESEQTVVELTFTTEGDIPADGLVVQLQGPPRAIAEFDVNATNPRLPEAETVVEGVTVTGGNIVGTDEVAGSLFLRITDPTATITVPVFQDNLAEGPENLTFNLLDGEAYEVDAEASSIDVTIEDGIGGSEGDPVVSFTATPTDLNEAEGTPITFNFSVDGAFPEEGLVIRTDANFFPNPQLDFNLLDFENPDVISGIEFSGFEELAPGQFLIDWLLTEPEAFISVAVFDDNLAEADSTFTTGILPGEGYLLNPDATFATISVTDGVAGVGGPVVGLAVEPTALNEGDALTITLTAEGEIPEGGLEVFVDSPITGAIGEFITVDEDGNPNVTFDGLADFPAPNEDGSGFTAVLTGSTATISFDVFDDGPGEGPETFEFNVLDGENYDVDPEAGAIAITINDGDAPPTGDLPVLSFTAEPAVLNEEEGTGLVLNFTVEGEFPEEGVVVRLDESFFDTGDQIDFNIFELENLEFFGFEETSPGLFTIDYLLSAPEGSITTAVFDDNVAEAEFIYSPSILPIPDANYTINPDASAISVSVIDGVDGTGGPVVSLAVDNADVNEGDPLTLTLTAEGEIPEGGIEVFVDSGTAAAIGEFITVSEEGIPNVTLTGIEGLPAPDGDASGFTVTLVENTATISIDSIFDDGPTEGPEVFEFTVADGETYDIDPAVGPVTITLNDGGEDAVFAAESGVTSVFLDLPLLEEAAGLTLVGTDSDAEPFSDDFQVGFAITDETDFTFAPAPFMPLGGTIEHSGTITLSLGTAEATVGEFSIGFDASRVTDTASGFFVADTLDDPLGLEVLFDLSAPGTASVMNEELEISGADLLVSPELAGALGMADLAGSDVGDARVDAMVALTDGVTPPAPAPTAIAFDEVDGEALAAGTVITDQFEGLTVSTPDTDFGAMIFDSANPTGGDTDLLAPELGNVLIISEDGDGSDPDDNATGGVLRFEWDSLVGLSSVGLLDIEESGGSIQLFGEDDALIQTVDIPALSDNSLQEVALGASGVTRMDVLLAGSGAVTEIAFTSEETMTVA